MVKILTFCGVGFTKTKISKNLIKTEQILQESHRSGLYLSLSFIFLFF